MLRFASMPLRAPGTARDDADVELLAQGAHDCRIGEVVHADLELVGDVLFCLRKPHLLAELHPRHQISSGADAPHAGGKRVAHRHPVGIAGAYLQAVDAADLDHRRAASREHVRRRHLEHRHAADAHADVGVDGDLGDPAAFLDDGHGAGHVPGGAPARICVDHGPEEMRAGFLHDRPPLWMSLSRVPPWSWSSFRARSPDGASSTHGAPSCQLPSRGGQSAFEIGIPLPELSEASIRRLSARSCPSARPG